MRFISNLIWLIFGGLWLALLWCVLGILLCISVIGIPLGLQCFKAARLSLAPYGKKVMLNFNKHPVANILWAIFAGWEMAIVYLIFAILNFVTIIGIPRGIQCLKFMKLAFFPFGAVITK